MRWTDEQMIDYLRRVGAAPSEVGCALASAPPVRVKHPQRREESHQIAYFEWASLTRLGTGQHLNLFIHFVSNGGYRTPFEAARFKAAGVTRGFPDIECVLACSGFHGLHIEMKEGRNQPTADQLIWHERLRACGRKVVVCWTWNEAAKETTRYIGADPLYGPITEYEL